MDWTEINLRHLRATVEIAERGTMNAAAAAVSLTQPAITQALARFEAMLDAPLFDRRHDGMTVTDAGALLVPRFRAALDHIASPHVTMARFRALIALADAGSYPAASAATGLSIPSLHRAVNDLSLSLRRPLVRRRGKVVMLTEAGVRMARAFRLARVELVAALAELAALKGHETRSIVIGAMPLSRARVLPAAVSRFLRRRPGVRITILEGSRTELIEPLRNGAIDMMVGALRQPLLEADFEQAALFDDRPVVIARAGHPLAGTRPSMVDLARYPWIIAASGAPLRESWEALFSDQGIALPVVPIESGSVMTIRQLLIDNDFLTLLSPDQVTVELEARWLCRIDTPVMPASRSIGVTTRASWRPTTVQAEFMADLEGVSRS
ncbi:LysR family transcriptional regulator [Sphingobium sp. Z007]|uniref:LysR family transcriptional regulator n=1 Tax=Sphingobium sp. Z007 TaxID=627495 RepID=UPI000B49B1A8|nr:LysR family transcriptional regulator [Sphingobium sp. Z007]